MKNYLEHTIAFDVDALKEVPIRLGSDKSNAVEQIATRVIEIQAADPRYDYASNEQIEIDRLVYEAYGLNEDDILEVENWYARRYPALAAAQRANLECKLAGENKGLKS
jgi:hypothetical protein